MPDLVGMVGRSDLCPLHKRNYLEQRIEKEKIEKGKDNNEKDTCTDSGSAGIPADGTVGGW